MTSVNFAALLCSRLCHDLVSPVGALSNGLEILSDEHDDSMRDQVMALLGQSARQTSNRLQFFRLAFGAGSGFGETVDPREGKKALDAFFEGSKVTLEWDASISGLPRGALKLLLNLALVVGEGLIRGGVLRVSIHPSGAGLGMEISAQGTHVLFSDAARDAIAGNLDEANLEPRTAPAYLAGTVARDLKAELNVGDVSADGLVISVELP